MFNKGDRVVNETHGKGTIISTTIDDNYSIEVEFDNYTGETECFKAEGYYDTYCNESDRIRLLEKEIPTNQQVEHNNNQTNCMLRALSDGIRKFKIKYRDIQQYINREDIRNCKVKTITGTIENFNPNAEVSIQSDSGFIIIQYKQILQMEEIEND